MKNLLLRGKTILITAGPTRESIDPVQYISSRTDGKTGYDVASNFLQKGASVVLVSGPFKIDLVHPMLTMVKVTTACEMYLACCQYFENADATIFAAAVSDYRPKETYDQKMSHEGDVLTIKMVKNIDIAAAFAAVKRPDQVNVGVTTDSNGNLSTAFKKMESKNLDMLIVKSYPAGAYMAKQDFDQFTIIKKDYTVLDLPLESNKLTVDKITNEICQMLDLKHSSGGASIRRRRKFFPLV